MRGLDHFSIQLKSLKNGTHYFKYQIDSTFFQFFEFSPISDAIFTIEVEFERENKNFEITIIGIGSIQTNCDRCTADIALPINFTSKVYAQISDYPNHDDIETYFIEEKDTVFNIAEMVYNEICLNQPLVNVYECESDQPPPCDRETLEMLEAETDNTDESEDDDTSSPWDSLKDANFN